MKYGSALGIFISLFLFVSLSFPVLAQYSEVQEWPKGQIVLTSGDTLYGPLTYHRAEDIIRITLADGSINAFAPVNVQSFTVADKSERVQTFRPYFWNRGNDYSDYKIPAFFESVTDGNYTLVRRQILAARPISTSPMYAGYGRYYDPYYGGTRYQTIVQDVFYLYTPAGKLIELRHPERNLEALYNDKADAMKSFVKKNKLNYNDGRDLVAIIRYLNRLP